MARSKKAEDKSSPVHSPRARENQIINLAYDEAEKRIRKGTATSQLLTFFLKLGSLREQMELEKIKSDLKLAEAKINQINEQKDIKKLYQKAIDAQKKYRGSVFSEEEEDDYYGEEY